MNRKWFPAKTAEDAIKRFHKCNRYHPYWSIAIQGSWYDSKIKNIKKLAELAMLHSGQMSLNEEALWLKRFWPV